MTVAVCSVFFRHTKVRTLIHMPKFIPIPCSKCSRYICWMIRDESVKSSFFDWSIKLMFVFAKRLLCDSHFILSSNNYRAIVFDYSLLSCVIFEHKCRKTQKFLENEHKILLEMKSWQFLQIVYGKVVNSPDRHSYNLIIHRHNRNFSRFSAHTTTSKCDDVLYVKRNGLLIDWWIDCLIDFLFDWFLFDWFFVWLIDSLIHWFIDCSYSRAIIAVIDALRYGSAEWQDNAEDTAYTNKLPVIRDLLMVSRLID